MPKNSYPGKFIVIEGIDGAGGETQTKKIVQYLKKEKAPVASLSYPDYKGPIGDLIQKYLYKKYNFSKEVQFLLYFADFLKDKTKIQRWLQEGRTIVADRYFTSTIAYQCLDGFSLERAIEVSKVFSLPKPDLVIYLAISSEVSIARKYKEKAGKLDRHEEDKKFLGNLASLYKDLAKKQVLAKWAVVNGEQSIEEVFTEIKKVIR